LKTKLTRFGELVVPASDPSQWRPDIDGLRALSVVAVVMFHIEKDFLPSGFLGVDVFFVISGFLIGGLVLRQVDNKVFSYRQFLFRRIRRLTPALILVALATSTFSFFLFAPGQLEHFGLRILGALFGFSNILFSLEDPYNAVELGSNFLLHTWSLGVEEQFYLLLPATLMAISTIGARFRIWFLAGLALSSLAFALLLGAEIGPWNFYSLPSRAWELLAGVLLAWIMRNGRGLRRTVGNVLGIVGGVSLVASFFLLKDLADGPAAATLLPVLGAGLVIIAGPENVVAKFLSVPLVRWIGLVSYPLYLWHFPLLAGLQMAFPENGILHRGALMLVALLLAGATYHLVELPVRRQRLSRSRLWMLLGCFAMSVVVALTFLLSSGVPARLGGMPRVDTKTGPFGPVDNSVDEISNVYLVGDSHAATLFPSLLEASRKGQFALSSWNEKGCLFLPGLAAFNSERKELSAECTWELQDRRFEWLINQPTGTVVIAGRLQLAMEDTYFDNLEGLIDETSPVVYVAEGESDSSISTARQATREAFAGAVGALVDKGFHVIVVYPVPEIGLHVPEELTQRVLLNGFQWPVDEPLSTSFEAYQNRTKSARELLDSIVGIDRVDPAKVFCNVSSAGRCDTHDSAAIYYRDDDHLSGEGASLVVSLVLEKIATKTVAE
jgi:peptidoglycan/LPS O-acetylase OafA/YrhL